MSSTGFDGKLYYAATIAAPASATWVELTLARDVSTSMSADKADISDRRSKFKQTCPAMIDVETTVTFTYVNSNAGLDALRDAFLARTPLQLAVMDGDISTSGSEGFVYACNVYSTDFAQPLNDGQTVSVTFSLAPTSVSGAQPQWYTKA
tara:strand:+ start:1080 stop:1529 length:450 start_codon:yes stop_codon:yes gene_type:complete